MRAAEALASRRRPWSTLLTTSAVADGASSVDCPRTRACEWPLHSHRALQNDMTGLFATISSPLTINGLAMTTLPPGVTLQQIDGGPTYYADHGFTYAVNMRWDDPNFFPIGIWDGTVRTQGDA